LKVGEAQGPAATPFEDFANAGLNKAGKRGKKKKAEDGQGGAGKPAQAGEATGAEAVDPVQRYKCPLFRTTLRLSAGLVSSDQGPVEYLKLSTLAAPAKWTKRAVALLLEADRSSE